MKEIYRILAILSKLPSIGPRSARRILSFLLKKKGPTLSALIYLLEELRSNTHICNQCFNVCFQNPCEICTHPKREPHILCVVADLIDLWAIEELHIYKGHYHVLGGLLSIPHGVGPKNLRIDALIERLLNGPFDSNENKNESYKELILALPSTMEANLTRELILQAISSFDIKITTLAQGMPHGMCVETMDGDTLSTAFFNRQVFARISNKKVL